MSEGGFRPKVSIVVPTYNAARTIGPLLDSLLSLDYDDYEVIVVNDGSRDNTRQLAEAYPVRLINQSNRGASAARDAGLRVATGEIVAYVDSDVTVERNWLRELVAPLVEPNTAAATGRTVFETNDRCASWVRSLDIERRNRRRRVFTRLANGPNSAFRREVLLKVGGFNPGWYHAEDTEVSYRLWEAGYRIKYVAEAVVNHIPEENWRLFLRKRYRDARAFTRVLVRYPRVSALRDDFVSWDMKVQPPLYGLLTLLLVAVPMSIGTPLFIPLLDSLALGNASTLVFGVSEAVAVSRRSHRFLFLPISLGLSILKGYAWAFGLMSGIILGAFTKRAGGTPS